MKKERSDIEFFKDPETHFWALRAAIKRKKKVRVGKSWSIADYEDQIPFGGYHHLRRSWVICAEMSIALEEDDVPLAMGLLAKWMSVQEEVARGFEWGAAMRLLPIEDPCDDGMLGAVSPEEYTVALGYQKELEELSARRKGNKGKPNRQWWQRSSQQQQQQQQQQRQAQGQGQQQQQQQAPTGQGTGTSPGK